MEYIAYILIMIIVLKIINYIRVNELNPTPLAE